MTDHQTMIREVCEGLGRNEIVRGGDGVWRWETQPFEPHRQYDHCHLLIDWMVGAGWEFVLEQGNKKWAAFHPRGNWGAGRTAEDEDPRIAVLTAAWRALKDE